MTLHATVVDVDTTAHPQITEASGLAWDRGGVWIHNDSGDQARLWWWQPGLPPVEWRLPGCLAWDWEDICIGPSIGNPKVATLWIGDVGSARPAGAPRALIACPLPAVPAAGGNLAWSAYGFAVAAGMRDCEAIFASWTSGLYAISKDHRAAADVWQLSPIAGVIRPRKVASVPLSVVTAADMAADGSRLAIRNYDQTCVWNRRPGESTVAMLQRAPDAEILDHAGAESISWEDPGHWWTITEGRDSRLKRWALA